MFKIPIPKVPGENADAAPKNELIPVICAVCNTRMYSTMDQVGKSIECPDCYTQTLIKAPKEKPKRTMPRMDAGFGYEVGPEPDTERTRTLGQEYLEQADKEVEKKLEKEPPAPDKPFLSGIFLYPFYGRIFPVVLGTVLAWMMVLSVIKMAFDSQGMGSLAAPFLLVGSAIVLVLVLFPTLVTFQKMFENTSNGDEDTDCRPDGGLFAFIDWIGDVMPIVVAFFLSCFPGMILMKSLQLAPEYYLGVAFSAFILFPVVHLSILESASISGIYSKPVWTSFAKVPGSWCKFYFLSTLMFCLAGAAIAGLVVLATRELNGLNVAGAIVCLFGVIVSLTIYFRLMGRLAFVMSQEILVETFERDDDSGEPTSNRDAKISLGV